MNHRQFGPQDYQTQPWKNGLGFTTELAACKDEQGELIWRLSKAPVNSSGPFSDFSGCERTLVLLEGAGLLLRHRGQAEQRLECPLQMAQFSGDWRTEGLLLAGPILDFNIITRRARCQAKVEILRDRAELAEVDGEELLYAHGELALSDRQGSWLLPAGWLLHRGKGMGPLQLAGGPAIHVLIQAN